MQNFIHPYLEVESYPRFKLQVLSGNVAVAELDGQHVGVGHERLEYIVCAG